MRIALTVYYVASAWVVPRNRAVQFLGSSAYEWGNLSPTHEGKRLAWRVLWIGSSAIDSHNATGATTYMNEAKVISEPAKKSIQAAVKMVLNGDKNHGWVGKDAVSAILCLIAEENGADVKDYVGSDLAMAIDFFINPSATAQYLEKNNVINKREGRITKRENIFAGFNA